MAKTFDELTIMDDYIFAQVMRNKKYLCPLLEHILGMKIVDLKFVEPQKTEKEGYESKGVRLDIYIESEDGTIYDVEVQTTDKRNLASAGSPHPFRLCRHGCAESHGASCMLQRNLPDTHMRYLFVQSLQQKQ